MNKLFNKKPSKQQKLGVLFIVMLAVGLIFLINPITNISASLLPSFLISTDTNSNVANLTTPSSQGSDVDTQSVSHNPYKMWQPVREDLSGAKLSLDKDFGIKIASFNMLRLSKDVLLKKLKKAPLEFTQSAKKSPVYLAMPMPDGGFLNFSIVESPIMEPELAAQFPEIKTYSGYQVGNPNTTMRFDVNPEGVHAIIFNQGETIYIDPSPTDKSAYLVYNKQDYARNVDRHGCLGIVDSPKDIDYTAANINPAVTPFGSQMRTFRTAIAVTGEYTQAAGGTVPLAMARIVNTVNRLTGIYQRELNFKLMLVANESSIIFTNAATDPYTNVVDGSQLTANVNNINSVIGSANYDVGHLFTTDPGGGLAGLGVVGSSQKASGATGLSNPVGDAYDVDFVAHEFGHQFGANHTFNANATGSCAGGNREPTAAYEPGSGSTIMAYASICGTQDLQGVGASETPVNSPIGASDDYFHVKSLQEISNYISSVTPVVGNPTTNNQTPTVMGGSDFSIPKGTPFTLTATGSDPDSDPLTYCWEEFDLGAAPSNETVLPNTDVTGGARPIFRSFPGLSSPSRTFPDWSVIVNNAAAAAASGRMTKSMKGESLPSISRTLNFQVTARDGKGGTGNDTVALTVVGTAGPFTVTQPASGSNLTGGASQTVVWNVASTSSAPINTANVNILLSTDGGVTFPTTLLSNTPNDGSQAVTIPNVTAANAFIKVEAVGNVFFNVSPKFSITGSVQASTSTTVASNNNPSFFGQSVTFTATVTTASGTPTGTVTFKDGATTLGTGTLSGSAPFTATFSTSSLSVATHSITAVYGGDTNFATSTSAALSQVVNQATTSTTVVSNNNPSTSGQSVMFTATVSITNGSGTPTGTVTFNDGATTLGTGTLSGSAPFTATFSTSSLSVATHSITAVYGGDTNFATSTSAALSQVVNSAAGNATSTTVVSNNNPSVFGQSVMFTATVTTTSGTPTGTVTFKDGATTLGTGTLSGSAPFTATFSTSSLSAGTHSITAVYGGDANFATSTSAALSQVVNQVTTSTTVVSNNNPSFFGQSVMFTATVTTTSGTPTGTVTFKDGATTLGTGTLTGSAPFTATFSTTTLSAGTHSITAVYGGDTNFATSTSSALSQVVNQATTSTAVVSNNNPSFFGQSVMFTATVTITNGAGTPTGTVTFKDGATTLGTGTLTGSAPFTATFSTSSLSVGAHSITAVYAGNANFTTSTSVALSQVVNQATTSTAVTSSSNPSVFEQSVTFTATVSITNGAGTPTGTVTFKDGATTLGTGTLSGSAPFTATFSTSSLSITTHSITAVYSGDANFATSTSGTLSQVVNQAATTTVVASSANPAQNNQSVTFTATVTVNSPSLGSPVAPTGTVTFKDGAATLGTGTLSSGVATFTTSTLTAGSHTITAVYSGDANFTGSTSTALIQIVGGTDHSTLYVADTLNSRIQRSTNDGATWQVIGNGVGTGLGQFNRPQGVTANFADTLIFVADTSNNRIQRSTNGGSTWQAIATAGTAANKVNAPQGVAYDEFTDILYIADTSNSRIVKVLAASTASPSFSVIATNGVGIGQVSQPQGLAVDRNGFLYIADTLNNRIQLFNGSWSILVNAGTTVGKVARPSGVYVNNSGIVFIADTSNNRIQMISGGIASVFMSAGTATGSVNAPQGVTFTISGNAFIGDTGNNRIQKKNFGTGISTVVGSAGTAVGKFNQPMGIR